MDLDLVEHPYVDSAPASQHASEILTGEKAREWALEQQKKNTGESFGKYQSQFKEALEFILDPENLHPYIVVVRNFVNNEDVPIGITGGKLEEQVAYRDWRIVRPDFEGQGIGQGMHRLELQFLPSVGISSIYTQAETPAGKKFIEKNGYSFCVDNWYCLELKKAA